MIKATNEQLRQEFQIFEKCWNFVKKTIAGSKGCKMSVEKMVTFSADAQEDLTGLKCRTESLQTLANNLYLSALRYIVSLDTIPELFDQEAFAFNRAWELLKYSYHVNYEDEEEWSEVVAMSRSVANKAGDSRTNHLCISLVVCMLDYVELVSKARFDKIIGM